MGEIQSALESDPDTEVKRKAVSALSRLPKEQGVPLLISVARTNRDSGIRKQALQALVLECRATEMTGCSELCLTVRLIKWIEGRHGFFAVSPVSDFAEAERRQASHAL